MAPGMKAQSTGQVEVEQGTVVRVQPITMELLDRLDAERDAKIQAIANTLAQPKEPYRIGPGDVLLIVVWDHPELTNALGEFRDAATSGQQVGEDGSLYYPYIGTIQAAGKTTTELRRILTAQLSDYIQNPQLDVRVAAYRSQKVYVVGEVRTAWCTALERPAAADRGRHQPGRRTDRECPQERRQHFPRRARCTRSTSKRCTIMPTRNKT